MEQLIAFWQRFDRRKQIVIGAATTGMFLAILGLALLASRPNMVLLFGGLEPGTAGEIAAALDGRGVLYRIEGNSILVDETQRDSLRVSLASEGLPASGVAGYELLDSLNGFGTTTQMFNATYLRAKEGELARTIQSSPAIRSARIHISQGDSGPFRRDQKATAAVTLGLQGPGSVTASHAQALQFLVASAVANLAPEDVAIIDDRGELISGKDGETLEGQGSSASDRLAGRVERVLEARVGPGNAMVEVSIERITQQESIVERLIDPESRVAISSETKENSASARNAESAMTVSSDLPEGTATNGGDSSENTAESLERVNYEVSETRREVLRTPGGIKRMTVAVLVNGVPDDSGALVPRSEDEITALTALVEDIVGFDAGRGDEITVQSMPFVGTSAALGTPAPGWAQSTLPSAGTLIRMGLLALVALVLGLFVLRPLLRKPTEEDTIELPALPDGGFAMAPLDGEIDDGMGFEALTPDFAAPAMATAAPDDPVARMRALIDARKDETMTILRSWLEDEKEREA